MHNGVTLVPASDEAPRHIMAIVEDLTESKRLASQMQQERDRLRLLLDVNDSLVPDLDHGERAHAVPSAGTGLPVRRRTAKAINAITSAATTTSGPVEPVPKRLTTP